MGHLWKRGKVWYMGFQDRRGKWKQESCRTKDKQAAKDILRTKERQVAAGEDMRLADFLREYLQGRGGLKLPTARRYTNCLDALSHDNSPLADVTLATLKPAAVTKYVNWRLGHGRDKDTVRREVMWLKQALDQAAEDDRIGYEALYKIKTQKRPELKKPDREDRILLPYEWEHMAAVASRDLRDVMTVALWTGWRKGNIEGITEAHVDFATDPALARFRQHEMKGGYQGLTTRLPARVRDILWDRWTGNPARRFFGKFYHAWQDLQRKKHVPPGFRFHDFRASYISYRIAAGIDPKRVQAEVGHKTSEMTMDLYADALNDPAVVQWAEAHFRFPWDTVTHMQDGTVKNGPQSREDNARSELER